MTSTADLMRVIRERKALAIRDAQLQAESPGWVFRPAGPVSVADDVGHLGAADQPPAVIGMDIARCSDDVIAELYTLITGEIHQTYRVEA